jgi:uncharacterized protein YqkB
VNQGLAIHYYKELKSVDNNKIDILMKDYKIVLLGDNLLVDYFEKDELHIKGIIKEIKFDYDDK